MKTHILLPVILLASLLVVQPESAKAQEGIEIIGTLRFFTSDGSLRKNISYGVGTKYTDTTDYEETLVPLPPPVSLYAWFNRPCDGEFAGDPCEWEQDYRGIPDSVSSAEVSQFSIAYEVGLKNETGGTINIGIIPSDWPEHIDSIHVEDAVLPRAFNHTFTGPVQMNIQDQFTSRLKVVVYYNLAVSAVNEEVANANSQSSFNILPNPLSGNHVTIRTLLVPGDRVVLSDMLGRSVMEARVTERREEMQMNIEGIASGTYIIARLNEDGNVVGRDVLQVVR